VGVDGNRVGQVQAGEDLLAGVGEHGGSAVRGVDMQPYVVTLADLGDRRQRVDRACVGGAGRRHDAERPPPESPVAPDRRVQCARVEPIAFVHWNCVHLAIVETKEAQAAPDRRVGLRGDVHDEFAPAGRGAPVEPGRRGPRPSLPSCRH
jgi:hypothetical protein